MNTDYAYCLNEKSCIHRRGCKRWIGNYKKEEVKELQASKRDTYIDEKECIPNYSDKNCKNNFQHLDRFRLSDGSEMK